MKKLIVALATVCLLNSGTAQASLVDRGGGLIFDTVLNITWLQDANYAKTSGHDADGKMSRADSIAWAESLTYGGYDDWRLAGNLNNAHPFHYGWWFGSSDNTPMTDPHSELSYMYYENLGLNGYDSNYGSWANNFGIHQNGTFGGQNNVGLIINLQGGEYLSNSALEPYPYERPWTFETNSGDHYMRGLYEPLYAWAVRDGDVAAVPEPETYAMLLAGLGLLGFMSRRKKQFS